MEKCGFEYSEALAERIRTLADKYEKQDFILADPSKFMHRYSNVRDKEIVALIAAALAFGKRSEILSHIEKLLGYMGDEAPSQWILEGKYEGIIPDSCKSFYRIFSYRSILLAFRTIKVILENFGSIGQCLEQDYRNGECCRHKGRLASVIGAHFPDECSPLISKGEDCANKRLNLFLRWMVRDNSPVDLGLWKWYPKTELLMPLDTHVVAMAKAFGFLSAKGGATLNQAIKLTDIMTRFFPDDPLKGDFALFGYGIEHG
ncbi:MAG: TIGR02757 family protein [Victivallales bacterium]|nr:TIGR02757 family protein [Victivallales bacterium]